MSDEGTIERLGVIGGTFDPPHYGHLVLADTARVQLSLERVLFAPAGQPPHKSVDQPSAIVHRMALLRAALADAEEPAFMLSRVDLDRRGPHYTVDALTLLREIYPRAELWFLIGADSLSDLPKWRNPNQIISLARLGVLPRVGYRPDLDDWEARLASRDGLAMSGDLRRRIDWLMGPALDISSELRERARQRFPVRFLVPPSVEAYIREHRLYDTEKRV